MYDVLKDKVKELFETEQIEGFLALKQETGHIKPHLFGPDEGLEQLSIGDVVKPGDARYPLAKILTTLLHNHSELRYAILVRACDQRVLNALAAWNQIPLERIIPLGVACPKSAAA